MSSRVNEVNGENLQDPAPQSKILATPMCSCASFQVETIGDAYMVSSGIPIPSANHASELADTALTLLHGVTNFKV